MFKKQILTFFSLAFVPDVSCRLEGAVSTVGTGIRFWLFIRLPKSRVRVMLKMP